MDKLHDCTIERYVLDLTKVKPQHWPHHIPIAFPRRIPVCRGRYGKAFDIIEGELAERWQRWISDYKARRWHPPRPMAVSVETLPPGAAIIRVTGNG